MTRPAREEAKRLGRAVVFVHQHDAHITNPQLRAEIEILLLTGRAMDFAARIKGHEQLVGLTHELVHQYAKYAGLGGFELTNTVLPKLKAADLIDYRVDSQGRIVAMEEFVGVSASVIEQTVAVLDSLAPSRTDLAVLHSVEIGAIAPLAESQHLEQIVKRGFTDQEAGRALTVTRAIGRRSLSQLNEGTRPLAIFALAHCIALHPDIYWHSMNTVLSTVKLEACREFNWTVDDAFVLLRAVDPEDMFRPRALRILARA
ncbi:hypothetical protein QYF68_04650 [Mycolicibacterium austroafricanum]|uniref:Uncharacterized protein n=1 Tax=Mycolicibacterium austroafricanum TaxID=39687 RepID=A0ABT8H8M7_MYCAO|nr:hypothetical protein [Mycolicibacterium austroafricanum]MDN4517113.1 hypothetical protein [Mycolicibacterium austroafricanum]